MHLFNSASVMHLIRQIVAAIMAVSILLVTAVPTVSVAMCALPDMGGMTEQMAEQMQTESIVPTMNGQDCYIECGCRIDTHMDGMPHQLAPHALSMNSAEPMPVSSHGIINNAPALIARLLSFSPPPPRTI